ncbi:PH domain-containing protein [Microbulbifer sp. TRSA002]|uniref:PH domain-containing protein n=1 Tax=Microbulbifer sp. TRSA002 TaxID=3243382 RepID=UPI00403A669E
MNAALKKIFPLLFLICISIFWGLYYSSNGPLNDYGRANYEWLLLIDGLIVLPILCLICSENKRDALLKILVFGSLVVLVGSYIIPNQSKVLWPYLEMGRYLLLAGLVIVEVTAIATMCSAIRAATINHDDPDIAIRSSVEKYTGGGLLAQILEFEARVWMFTFLGHRIDPSQYHGSKHFSYHLKDGAKTTALGFIFIILFELPIVHLLLHFIWSPMAANIVSFLTLFGLLFLVAEYRSMGRRPISLNNDYLIVRYGLFNQKVIHLSDIQSITHNSGYIPRSKAVKRFNFSGNPNILIELNRQVGKVRRIYIGVDQPAELISAVIDAKNNLEVPLSSTD